MPDRTMPSAPDPPAACLRLLAFLDDQNNGTVLNVNLPEAVANADAITLCKSRRWVRDYGASILDENWDEISSTGPGLTILPAGRAALAEHRLRAAETSPPSTAPDTHPSRVPARPSDVASQDVKANRLTPAEQDAYTAYEWGMRDDPTLKRDRDVWDHLKKRSEPPVPLPETFGAWRKSLGKARAKKDERKHNPRQDRPTGGPVARRRDM